MNHSNTLPGLRNILIITCAGSGILGMHQCNDSGGGPGLTRTESTMTVTHDGTPLLSYVHEETMPPEGVDPLYKRSAYIHPLWSPGGEVLTTIQPADHYHHYGIWNPWTHTRIDTTQIDFWNLVLGQGTVRFAEFLETEEGKDRAAFRVRHEHVRFRGDGSEQLAIDEVWEVEVHDIRENSYVLDLTTTLSTPLDGGILLEQYRYGGGLGFRATQKWGKENSSVLTSEGKSRDEADGTTARWVIIEGESSVPQGRSGILFMSHPENRAHPEPMRMWPSGQYEGQGNLFFEFTPIRHLEWKLEQGNDYTLQYRMVVFDGTLDQTAAEDLWNEFAAAR